MLFQPEQIQKIASTFVRVTNFLAAGNSTNVTPALSLALQAAGNGGCQVPLQSSPNSNTEGVIAGTPLNRVLIYDATTKKKLASADGSEVYARITEMGGVYTLTYFQLDPITGQETAVAINQAIDFEFAYRFSFEHLPADFAILVQERNVSEDPAGAGIRYGSVWELLTITAQNTFNPLTYSPTNPADVVIYANGKGEDGFAGGAFSINVTTKVITWNAANAGYNVKTTYRCFAVYKTLLS